MQRQQGVLVLIILILCTLLGWWLFSQYAIQSHKISAVKEPVLQIKHEQKGSAQIYTGAMMVSDCDLFSAGVEAQGGEVVELTVLLSITKSNAPCAGVATTTPFALSVDAKRAPVVKNVLVDGDPVFFDVVEAQ